MALSKRELEELADLLAARLIPRLRHNLHGAVSVDSKRFMLRGLCGSIFDQPMAAVTAQQAQELYTARTKAMVRRGRGPDTRPVAVATHHAELKLAREFWEVGR